MRRATACAKSTLRRGSAPAERSLRSFPRMAPESTWPTCVDIAMIRLVIDSRSKMDRSRVLHGGLHAAVPLTRARYEPTVLAVSFAAQILQRMQQCSDVLQNDVGRYLQSRALSQQRETTSAPRCSSRSSDAKNKPLASQPCGCLASACRRGCASGRRTSQRGGHDGHAHRHRRARHDGQLRCSKTLLQHITELAGA